MNANTNCGYCQTPFDAASTIAECSNCGTKQHQECWDEYGGCVLAGCTGFDKNRPAPTSVKKLPPVTAATVTPVEVTPPDAPGTKRKGSGNGVLIAAAAVLAVAVIGVFAFALLNSGGSDGPESAAFSDDAASPEPNADSSVSLSDDEESSRPSKADAASNLKKKLKALMIKVHRPLNYGDGDQSFKYISSRKQAEKGSGDAWYAAYRDGSWSSSATLKLNDLTVSNVKLSNKHGLREAEFKLAIGLSNGNCYRGTTWAVREHGKWKFDAGYGGREAERSGSPQMKEQSGSC